MKTLITLTIILFSATVFGRPLDVLKEQSFERVHALYLNFSDNKEFEKSYSPGEIEKLKKAGYEITAFKTPKLSKISTADQRLEFLLDSRKYSIEFREDGSAHVNAQLVDVTNYRDPVERLKYVDRALRGKAQVLPWWFGSVAWAAEQSPSLLVERLLESWNKESKKWIGSRLYNEYVKKDGVASLDTSTVSSLKQLFSAKDLVGIDVNCDASVENVYSDTVKEGGENWICGNNETMVKNKSLLPRTVTLYHEDGSISQITVGVQHPASSCNPASTQLMPMVGSITKIQNGRVTSERVYRFKWADAEKLQDKATLPEERAAAAAVQCCKSDGTKDGNCFDKMVVAAEKSKITNKGAGREAFKGEAGVR